MVRFASISAAVFAFVVMTMVPISAAAEEAAVAVENQIPEEPQEARSSEGADGRVVDPWSGGVETSGQDRSNWHREDRRAVVAGWSVLGTFYIVMLIYGSNLVVAGSDRAWLLFIPVTGPFVAGVTSITGASRYQDDLSEDLVTAFGILGIVVSLFQAMGLSFLVEGYRRRARRERAPSTSARSRSGASVMLAGPGGPGASVVGWF